MEIKIRLYWVSQLPSACENSLTCQKLTFPILKFFCCLFFNAILVRTNDSLDRSGDPNYISLCMSTTDNWCKKPPMCSQVSLQRNGSPSKLQLIDWIQGQSPGAASRGKPELQGHLRSVPAQAMN